MKNLISLTLLLLATCTLAAAQPLSAMLRLRLSDRSPIAVELDGRYYEKGTSVLTLDGLRPGPHRVTVFMLPGDNARPVRIYTGTLRLDAGTQNMALVDVNRRSLRLRTEPAADAYADGGEYQRDDRNVQIDDNRGEQGGDYHQRGADDVYSDRSYGGDDRGRNNSDRENSGGYEHGAEEGYGSFPHGRNGTNMGTSAAANFSQRDMDDLAARIKGRITDTDKEQLLKNVLSNRIAYTDQIRLMLSWLSFDSTKLDFAKWAYERAADRKNYWKLEDVFSFSSSKEEFSKYISGR